MLERLRNLYEVQKKLIYFEKLRLEKSTQFSFFNGYPVPCSQLSVLYRITNEQIMRLKEISYIIKILEQSTDQLIQEQLFFQLETLYTNYFEDQPKQIAEIITKIKKLLPNLEKEAKVLQDYQEGLQHCTHSNHPENYLFIQEQSQKLQSIISLASDIKGEDIKFIEFEDCVNTLLFIISAIREYMLLKKENAEKLLEINKLINSTTLSSNTIKITFIL